MSGFNKLFSTIIASSIWEEDDATVRVWITLLALKDSRGVVEAAVPGLARLAKVDLAKCELALAKFMAADLYSRDLERCPEQEGRRIEKVPGGWRVLNHEFYRDLQVERDYSMSADAIRKREYRRRVESGEVGQDVGQNGTAADDGRSSYASASVSERDTQNNETDNRNARDRVRDFMARHDFGPWKDVVEGYLRANRRPINVMAELDLWLAGELGRRKTDGLTLGEAVNAYAASEGHEQFKTNHFGGFVRGVHRASDTNAGHRARANEAATIERERVARIERERDEAESAERAVELILKEGETRLRAAKWADLKRQADAAVDAKFKGRTRATLVRDKLLDLLKNAS